jgi:hypothetical protein
MIAEGKARLLSCCAGILFGIGWLVFIDAIAHFNGSSQGPFQHFVLVTFSLISENMISFHS